MKARLRCLVPGGEAVFDVYVGEPAPGHPPLELQLAWLREVLGGEVQPAELRRLHEELAQLAKPT